MYETESGWDVDEISLIDLDKIVKSLGHDIYKSIRYRHPERDLSDGLRPLNTDKDVIQFMQDVRGHTKVDIYVEHLIDNPVIVEENIDSRDEVVEVTVCGVAAGDGKGTSDPDYKNSGSGKEKDECDVAAEQSFSDTEDEEYDGSGEEDVDSLDDISLDDSDYDEGWEWTCVLPEGTLNPSSSQIAGSSQLEYVDEVNPGGDIGAATTSRNPRSTSFDDFENEDGDSDDLDSPDPSEEEEETGKKNIQSSNGLRMRYKLHLNLDKFLNLLML